MLAVLEFALQMQRVVVDILERQLLFAACRLCQLDRRCCVRKVGFDNVVRVREGGVSRILSSCGGTMLCFLALQISLDLERGVASLPFALCA